MKDAEDAIENLNGYDLEGRRIRVEKAKRNKPRDQTPGRYLGHYKSRNVVRRSNSYRLFLVFIFFYIYDIFLLFFSLKKFYLNLLSSLQNKYNLSIFFFNKNLIYFTIFSSFQNFQRNKTKFLYSKFLTK